MNWLDMAKKFKEKNKAVAKDKILLLFEEAAEIFPKDRQLANKRVSTARNIAMKNKVRLPASIKRRFCKNCYSYLVPGINLRIRNNDGKVVYYCLECKKFMRFPYREKR
jgi:ribonuclease P protein subunit RPR2